MAVQKSRRTPSTRGMRRSHDHLSLPALFVLGFLAFLLLPRRAP